MSLFPHVDVDAIVAKAQAPVLERLDRVIELLEHSVYGAPDGDT